MHKLNPICRKCGATEVSAKRAAKSDYRCNACLNADNRAYRAMRPSKRVPPEKRRAYDAVSFKRDMADPVRRQKHMARMTVRKAIARGKIERGPCEVCGSRPAEAHHDDYSKPLAVRFLCPAHHREHHAKTPAPIYATHERAYDGSPTTFWFSDAGLTRREGWSNGYVADGSIRPADLGHEARAVVLMVAPGVPAASLKLAAE